MTKALNASGIVTIHQLLTLDFFFFYHYLIPNNSKTHNLLENNQKKIKFKVYCTVILLIFRISQLKLLIFQLNNLDS